MRMICRKTDPTVCKGRVLRIDHPAAIQVSREQATRLLDGLKEAQALETADLVSQDDSSTDIDTITDDLLAIFA